MREDEYQGDHGSLLRDALRSVTRVTARRPRITLWLVLLTACASIGVTVGYIRFKTDRADLIDPNAAFHQRWINYTESFGDASDMVVVVEADSPQVIKQVIDELGSQMARESELFDNVLYKVEPGLLREKGLQYLGPEQLELGLERIAEFSPILQGRWELLRIDSLVQRIRLQLESTGVGAASDESRYLLQHAELLSTSLNRFLSDRNDYRSPWPEVLPVDPRMRDGADQVIYFLNDEGTMGFLKAFPAARDDHFNGPTRAIDRLRQLIRDLTVRNPSVTISLTGIPVLESDEMRRSQDDMLTASVISFFGVGLILFVGFRGFRHPLLALFMLAIGMAWSFGYTTLAVGHLNILSVSFAVILIGLGIDFGIHYLARYLELRHDGHLLRPALLDTSGSVGTGIVTAAVTTSLAFFCAIFTQFLGVAELGIIAGGGILLCALATFVVLPALVALADQHVEPKKLPTPFEANALRASVRRHPFLVMFASLGVIGGIGAFAIEMNDGRISSRVKYDYNLLNLQAEGLESVEIQKRLFQDAHDSLLFAVSLADTPEEARILRAKFEALPSVHHVEELASRLPNFASSETQLLVQAFRAQLSKLPTEPPRIQNIDPVSVGRALEKLYLLVRTRTEASAVETARALDMFLDRFEQLPLSQQVAFLTEYQMRMLGALIAQFQALEAASNSEPVTLADLPPELTSRFVSPEGKWLVQVYPKEEIWDIEPLTRFVNEIRSIDQDATGTPLQNYEASQQIMESYEVAAFYALVVICVVLLIDFLRPEQKLFALMPPALIIVFTAITLQIRQVEVNWVLLIMVYIAMVVVTAAVLDFRNLRDVVLTLLTPIAGGILMFGVLGLLGIDLNPANLIVLPLVLGIGVDDGVHVVHDFRMQAGRVYRTSSSTINAIVLTSLTSMVGFGSMVVASHRGLSSVGLILVVGVGSCLFVSLVTLPAILTLVSNLPSKKRESPVQEEKPVASEKKNRVKARTAGAA